jgi:transcriptional regulator of acetoin/glycerol metabolism
VRFCSATHGELRALVGQGKFREDLFFRMGRPDVTLPPLRERKEEIPLLMARALEALPAHASLVEAALLRPWPGNVRELLLEVREAARTARAAGAARVEASHLSALAGQPRIGAQAAEPAEPARSAPGREQIEDALRAEEGNVARAARKLAVHRTQLRRWLQKLDIDPRSFVNPKHQRTVEQDDES